MAIRIGENVKMLRKQRDITQEQLAELLGVSNAAISKWERGETYPDISLLPIIAHYFSISLDELIGYDKKTIDYEIDVILNEFKKNWSLGNFDKAGEIITDAFKKYKNDYNIKLAYIKHLIGGEIADKEKILKNKDIILDICEQVLSGCTIDNIRLEAINIKAKVLHSTGNTEKALNLLKTFPHTNNTSSIKSEQLFEYSSKESKYWVKRNLYSLANQFAIKFVKHYWFGKENMENKEKEIEEIADKIYNIYKTHSDNFFLLMSCSLYEALGLRMTAHWANADDIIRIRRKQLECSSIIDSLLETDDVLREGIFQTYNGSKLTQWTVNYLKTVPAKTFEKMRNNQKYMQLLNKYSKN